MKKKNKYIFTSLSNLGMDYKEDIDYLEEPYVPHKLVGVMAKK